MPKFSYTPDKDLKVHEEGAIRLLCQSFRSHENGLPEWCKNSSDAYARENYPQEERVIVLFLQNAKGDRLATVSCLDFVGMTSDQIDNRFRHWADPNAAIGGIDITHLQGGHGNGGKCYMTQMFEEYAYIYTVKEGKGNHYGVQSGSFRFGYIPDSGKGRDFPITDQRAALTKALSVVGVRFEDLPTAAKEASVHSLGFTFVTGVKPKDVAAKIPVAELLESLLNHQQMIRTLQLCRVYLVADSKKINQGKPLVLPEITPMEGATDPRIVVVPETLVDPKLNRVVSTTDDGKSKQGTLILKTSDKSMRWQRKYRH